MHTALDTLVAEAACRDLVLAAADAVDGRDFLAFADLFETRGVLVRPDGCTRMAAPVVFEFLSVACSNPNDEVTWQQVMSHAVQRSDSVTPLPAARRRCDAFRPVITLERCAHVLHEELSCDAHCCWSFAIWVASSGRQLTCH